MEDAKAKGAGKSLSGHDEPAHLKQMSKPSTYESLLQSVSGPITVETVKIHRWGFIKGQPFSPTIIEAWIAAGLIVIVSRWPAP